MRPAEMKAARESLGLITPYIAQCIGVHLQMIFRYESPNRKADVPEHVAQVVRSKLAARASAVERLTAVIRASDAAEPIPRHTDLAAFYAWAPEMDGWGSTAQSILLHELHEATGRRIENVA